MNILIPLVILSCIIGVCCILFVDNYLFNSKRRSLIKLITIGFIINIFIFMYLKLSFSKIRTRKGPQGPRGLRGDKGYIGMNDSCAVCGPQENTFAYENLEKMKKNLVIPKKPLLKKIKIKDTKNYYFKINKIFTEIIGCNNKLVNNEKEAKIIIDDIINNRKSLILCQHSNFRGKTLGLDIGTYDLNNFILINNTTWKNQVSSLKLKHYTRLIINSSTVIENNSSIMRYYNMDELKSLGIENDTIQTVKIEDMEIPFVDTDLNLEETIGEPTEAEIIDYLQINYKNKADSTVNDQQKRMFYKKCYGVNYIEDISDILYTRYNTRVINPYNKNKSDVEIDANVFTNECPDKQHLQELYATTGGGALHTIYGKCSDGTILRKGGANRGNLKKSNIGKTNSLDIYSSNSEHQWARRISGIGDIKSSDVGNPTKLSCNDGFIVGFNTYYNKHDRGKDLIDGVSLICAKEII